MIRAYWNNQQRLLSTETRSRTLTMLREGSERCIQGDVLPQTPFALLWRLFLWWTTAPSSPVLLPLGFFLASYEFFLAYYEHVRPTVCLDPNGLKQGALLPRLAQSLMRPWEGAR
jgi:hypothetical protein